MPSILIPAFNEAAVIADMLKSVLASAGGCELEIVVVCNACQDATADIARSVDPRLTVLETKQAGKCHALNLGEQYLSSFPRIYLDADIQVSPTFVKDMVRALEVEEPRSVWPDVEYDLQACSGLVSNFYRVWTSLPYNRPGRIGVGAYALNQAARGRFAAFPEIISDDGFIRGLFDDNERVIITTCRTLVKPPRDLGSLIAVGTRSRLGAYELRHKHPEVMRKHYSKVRNGWRGLAPLLHPRMLAALPIYVSIVLWTKYKARRRLARRQMSTWDRDLTARTPAP